MHFERISNKAADVIRVVFMASLWMVVCEERVLVGCFSDVCFDTNSSK